MGILEQENEDRGINAKKQEPRYNESNHVYCSMVTTICKVYTIVQYWHEALDSVYGEETVPGVGERGRRER